MPEAQTLFDYRNTDGESGLMIGAKNVIFG